MPHIVQRLDQLPAFLFRNRIKPDRISSALHIVDHGAEADIFRPMFLILTFPTAAKEKNSEIFRQKTSPACQLFLFPVIFFQHADNIRIFRFKKKRTGLFIKIGVIQKF